MHAFLYKGKESKLFSGDGSDAKYEAALSEGWTDAPVKVISEVKANVKVNDIITKVDSTQATVPLPPESKPVEKATKFKKIIDS